jgi:hypothetical protein
MVFRYVDCRAFFASLLIGIVIVYFTVPSPTYITKFPTPFNSGRILYVSDQDGGGCFKYVAEKVACEDQQERLVHKQPPAPAPRLADETL